MTGNQAAGRLLGDRRGGTAPITSLAPPSLLVGGSGAVEIRGVESDRAVTQNVADAAALWGAQQLSAEAVCLAAGP